MQLDCTGVLSLQPSGCLDLPALLRSTAGASRHPRLQTQPRFQGFFPQKMGGSGKALPSAGRFFFAIVFFPPPFPFSKGQNPGNEIAGN